MLLPRALLMLVLLISLELYSSLCFATTPQEEVARNIVNKPVIPPTVEMPPTKTKEIIIEPKKEPGKSAPKKTDTTDTKMAPPDSTPTVETITEYITAPPKRKLTVSKAIPKKAEKQKQPPPIVRTKKITPFFNTNGVYIDLNGGLAKVNWKNVAPAITHNGDGGFSMGMSLGVRLCRHIGVEAGGFHLANVVGPPNANEEDISRYRSWVGYAAVKLYAPVDPVGNIFVKIGAGDRYIRITNTAPTNSGTSISDQVLRFNQIVPMFGAGGEYALATHLMVIVQYFYFQAQGKAGAPGLMLPIPATHIFTIGFSLKFS